eukprot:1663149-Rhodomonas_salina.2
MAERGSGTGKDCDSKTQTVWRRSRCLGVDTSKGQSKENAQWHTQQVAMETYRDSRRSCSSSLVLKNDDVPQHRQLCCTRQAIEGNARRSKLLGIRSAEIRQRQHALRMR